MPNQETLTVANVVVQEFVSRFGVPRQLHTDQGRNFEVRLFQEMCLILEIEKTRTTPLRPQSDGMVERFNRTLEAMLAKFVDDDQRDWDPYLPLLVMAYLSSVHETTGFSSNADDAWPRGTPTTRPGYLASRTLWRPYYRVRPQA